jgi:alanyl-tRNA synthetase
MQKLCYEDSYKKEFTAEIIAILEEDTKFHIELDKTYFYPEGGGQPSDTGTIESSFITSVYEKDGHIYHVSETKPIKVHKVKCMIDFEKRFDAMQQHLGQHILSACFLELFKCPTIGFHLGKEYCTIDLDRFLDSSDIREAETLSNQIIFDNFPVEVIYPTKAELKKLPFKKAPPTTNEPLRIVKIDTIDFNPCCGIHPRSTLEVQMLKISKYEKYKSGMRIYFLCGRRAVADYFLKDTFTSKICNTLKCSETDALIKIEKLSQDFNKLSAENRALKSDIANYEVQDILSNSKKIGAFHVVKSLYRNADLKYAALLASKLTTFPNVIALLGIESENTANLIFMCSKDLKKFHMGNLLKDSITLIDGKGGGSSFSAQGGGKDVNNLPCALDYALMKIMQTIG